MFIKHLETAGWPPMGRMANADYFDRLVADRLKESGRKVAYLMVDALRYELGVALEKLLAEDGPVELQAAYAQLPTITLVGSLAESLGIQPGDVIASIDGKPLKVMQDLICGLDQAASNGQAADLTILRNGSTLHVSIPEAGTTPMDIGMAAVLSSLQENYVRPDEAKCRSIEGCNQGQAPLYR